MTMDTDVVVLLAHDVIPRLVDVMKNAGFSVTQSSRHKMEARLKRDLPVKFRYGRRYSVDLRIATYSLDREAIRRSEDLTLFDIKLPIASAEDPVVYKIAWFGEIDQADIKAIFVRHGNNLDFGYLKRSARKLVEETGNRQIGEHLQTALMWVKNIAKG